MKEKYKFDRDKWKSKVIETYPGVSDKYYLLLDDQIILMLLKNDLKETNLSYQQIQTRYNISQKKARSMKFIAVNVRQQN